MFDVVAKHPWLRGTQLRSRILSTADDLGTAGTDTKFGAGRVNAYRAVTGADLTNPEGVDSTPPAIHLRKRLALQRAH